MIFMGNSLGLWRVIHVTSYRPERSRSVKVTLLFSIYLAIMILLVIITEIIMWYLDL